MEGRFQAAAWLTWVKKLPEDVTRIRPVLSTQMAQAFMDAGEPEASESRLQDAERCLNGSSRVIVVADEEQLDPASGDCHDPPMTLRLAIFPPR